MSNIYAIDIRWDPDVSPLIKKMKNVGSDNTFLDKLFFTAKLATSVHQVGSKHAFI